jgi:thioredoxin 1
VTDIATPLPSVTEATFDEALAADGVPLLVDFWAPWCGPCRMVEPVLADIAALRRGSLRVVRVDMDENPGLSLRYGVMSVPTLLLFADGEPVMRLVGARGKGQLLAELDAHLPEV